MKKAALIKFILPSLFMAIPTFSMDNRDNLSTSVVEEVQELRQRGNQFYAQKSYREAIECYRSALVKEKSATLFQNCGMAHFQLGQLQLAEQNFQAALSLSKDEIKAKYWLGKIYARQNHLTKALFYLRAAAQHSNGKDVSKLLQDVEHRFLEVLNHDDDDPRAFLENFFTLSERLNIPNIHEIGLAIAQGASSVSVNSGLNKFWQEKNFSPLPRAESPQELAAWVGCGTRIATVIVQTLPIYFSQYFDEVKVYDISMPQINFHKNICETKSTGGLEKFLERESADFFRYMTSSSLPVDPNRIKKEFNKFYGPIHDMKVPNNILTDNADIFSAVNGEASDAPHDAVYLSTIPAINFERWPEYFAMIRAWLSQGKTIIYSMHLADATNLRKFSELTSGFEDLANASFKMFTQVPMLIYVKLTPRLQHDKK